MSKQARFFLYTVCLAGLATIVYGGIVWKIDDPAKFGAYLLTAIYLLPRCIYEVEVFIE